MTSTPQQLSATPPKKIGRPTMYEGDKTDETAFRVMLLGATLSELGEILGVTTDTLWRWQKEHSSFSDAIARGRGEADAHMAHSLYHRGLGARVKTSKPVILKDGDSQRVEIVEYVEGYPADTNAASLWLRNRRPDLWRDKQDVDVTLTGRIGKLPDEERSNRALELLKRLAQPTLQPGAVIDVEPEPEDSTG